MEVNGILKEKLNERNGVGRSGTPWKMADYLFEIPGFYPKHIVFTVSDGERGRFAMFDALIGKDATVHFNIEAREHEGRWFNSILAYAAYPMAQQQPPQ